MVVLIGGVGYAGKTLMAQALLEKYHIPYLSIDHLKMGLYKADPAGCGFTPLDSQAVIGEKLWPILKGIITTNIENKQHLIIEGCYLLPHRVAELDAEYQRDTISFYMGFSEAHVRRHYYDAIIARRKAIEARGDEYDDAPEAYIRLNAAQKDLCARYGARYFEIDGPYAAETAKVYAWLEREVASRRARA